MLKIEEGDVPTEEVLDSQTLLQTGLHNFPQLVAALPASDVSSITQLGQFAAQPNLIKIWQSCVAQRGPPPSPKSVLQFLHPGVNIFHDKKKIG